MHNITKLIYHYNGNECKVNLDIIKERKQKYGNNFPELAKKWNVPIQNAIQMLAQLKESRIDIANDEDSKLDYANYMWIKDNYEYYVAL